MKKYFFGIVAVVVILTACASKPAASVGMTLDQALLEAADRIDERIAKGTKIAMINFSSPSDQFSSYVLDEISANLVDSRNLIVIDRREIDLRRTELNFQMAGEVSDESMQALGQTLGAQSIVSGSLRSIGNAYRIMIRVLNVETAAVEVQYRNDIANDSRVASLLGGKPSGTGTAKGKDEPAIDAAAVQRLRNMQSQPARQSLPSPAGPFNIGDKGPAGGIIFYVNEAGFTLTADGTTCHYLEAAPSDLGSMAWASLDAKTTNITGLAVAVGAGKKNTDLILAADPNSPAANACKGYAGGGKNDWFLPSMSELAQLYNNREVVEGLDTTPFMRHSSTNYWSSSQQNREAALPITFSNGEQDSNGKETKNHVRAIRAF
ncbi:MAG: DUF1566 domain-containing protein [Treponema sp.]|jgi:TolB-like protein|nr:DUF1566 domain-containing protein [Treponema sp.]